jgi:hypothetical protein
VRLEATSEQVRDDQQGQSFDIHMLWHLAARRDGDTNFMMVLASTRVLAQPLAETYALPEPLFKAIDPAAF